MNSTKDLHLCGICKKIFVDLNIFLEHKSQCSSPQSNLVFSPNPQDISFVNGLFCNETVLDLTVLDGASFPLVLQCDNEEVVGDTVEIQPQQEHSQDNLERISKDSQESLDCILTPGKRTKDINEEDVANLLVTQLSKQVINKSVAQQTSLPRHEKAIEALVYPEPVSRTEDVEAGNEQIENVVEQTSDGQNQKNVCKICNFVSTYHRDLVRHMRKHTGERPYNCSVCGKRFARQDKLVTHKRIHSGDKRHKCQLCEYAATDSGALRKHLRIHTDERPHKCQMCSYRARNASHMTVHLRTHTGDSPFFCLSETCGRTFKTSTDLKRHMKIHKLDCLSPAYNEGVEKFSCKHLLKNSNLYIKTPHCYICQDITHKGYRAKKRPGKRRGALALCVRPHKCPHCSAEFVRQDSLRSHLKLHLQSSFIPNTNREEDVGSEGSRSPEQCSSSALLYLTPSELQDSLVSLQQDGTVHCDMENTFL